MTRQAFVHIGTHKTGTTYLQNWLHANREKLHELGLSYPKAGLPSNSSAHKRLSIQARSVDVPLITYGAWKKLKHEIEQHTHDVIISAETFSDKIETPCVAKRISDFFAAQGIETTFVVFLRDIPAYLNSRYVQDVKNLRFDLSFDEYVKRMRDTRAFNYPLVLEPFEEAAKVLVVPYTSGGAPLEEKLLTALGRTSAQVNAINWQALPRQNQSVGPVTVALARQIAAQLPADLSPKALRLKRVCFKTLSNIHKLNQKGFVGCDKQTANDIRAYFSAQTADIAARYFETSWEDTIPGESIFDKYETNNTASTLPPRVEKKIKNSVLNLTVIHHEYKTELKLEALALVSHIRRVAYLAVRYGKLVIKEARNR